MNAAPRNSLRRLRRRLTAWYAATFCGILVLLGGGLYVAIRHQLSTQLDVSLGSATAELMRAARIRELEAGARGRVVDAVEELHIPDRTLYLLDTTGTPITPGMAPAWIQEAARSARTATPVQWVREGEHEVQLRLHAERFQLASGRPLVAVAVANQVELEDQFASLIAAFGAAAAAAVILVAIGGSVLVRTSLQPTEQSMEQMRRFMADAAHELRTPLAVIRGRAEVVLQQPRERAAYLEAIEGIETETRRLGRIVEDLLTLARADAGERVLERRRVFLDDIVSDAVSAAGALAATRGVTLAIDEFEETLVFGDAALLYQLAMILLDNAVKFTPSGGGVRVRVGNAEGRARLVVADSGPGIPPDQLPHIFERFYRGNASRQRSDANSGAGGAGLGLAIARWIVDGHGATVDVASSSGQGTRVTVMFPLPAPEALSSS